MMSCSTPSSTISSGSQDKLSPLSAKISSPENHKWHQTLPNRSASIPSFLQIPEDYRKELSQYRVRIKQEPLLGRSCGFSSIKDRRYLDPPLILKLEKSDGETVTEFGPGFGLNFVCKVSLYMPDSDQSCDIVIDPKHRTPVPYPHDYHFFSKNVYQTIAGHSCAGSQDLRDPDGNTGIFFVFHDLSIRVQGVYRLKCHLIYAPEQHPPIEIGTIMTNPFQMFSPKVFPGMTESTDLSKCFAKQGTLIHVRRGFLSFPTE